ncbi:hypothetical protein [Belnapia moabensis]|nr:hypothetical protein [Belnapia moabensis]
MGGALSGTFLLLRKPIGIETFVDRVAALLETGETDKACAD